MLTVIFSNALFVLGMVAACVCIVLSFKGYKDNRKLVKKSLETYEDFKKVLENKETQSSPYFERIISTLEDVKRNSQDLNLRVSIAEVRLEERRPQINLPALPAPAKRGRKPKPK